MKPRGLLMKEHRLIEKMIEVIRFKTEEIQRTGTVSPHFIDTAVDFIRMYADRTHHGKEEEILFRDCSGKHMSEKDTNLMNELIDEHKYGRKTVAALVEAKEKYARGSDTLDIILTRLNALVEFYPQHIMKEDRIFFPDSERYFSESELNKMLGEFWEFDRNMIHEKYKLVVTQLKESE